MSAYAHQMEREFSSLSSRGNSELGSRFVIESGFYMTSFAATIFLASLVTVGVLMITLVIALSVMLQSCENRNSGIVSAHKPTDDYSYCKILALHAELNGLEPAEFPLLCRDVFIRYIKEGQYIKELNFTIRMADSYFESIRPLGDGKDAVLMDIDEILFSNPRSSSQFFPRCDQDGYIDYIQEAKRQKQRLTLELFSKLRSNGYSLVLLSRKSERERNLTTEQLISAGYSGWSSLIMRPDTEMEVDNQEYFFTRRVAMEEEGGFRITGVIGNHMDVLTGPSSRTRNFKLPSPVYFHSEDYNKRREES